MRWVRVGGINKRVPCSIVTMSDLSSVRYGRVNKAVPLQDDDSKVLIRFQQSRGETKG